MATIKEQLKEISDNEKKIYFKSVQQSNAYMDALKIDAADLEYMVTIKAEILLSVDNNNTTSAMYKLIPMHINIVRYGFMDDWQAILQVLYLEEYGDNVEYAGNGTSFITVVSDELHNKILGCIANGNYKLFVD